MSATSLMRLGCKPKLTSAQVAQARKLMDAGEGGHTVGRGSGVARSTLFETLKAAA